jgi:hypothetical protein
MAIASGAPVTSRNHVLVLFFVVVSPACVCSPLPTVELVPQPAGPSCRGELTLGTGELFWADSCLGEIDHLPLDGGTSAKLTSTAAVSGMVANRRSVLWLEAAALKSFDLDAGRTVTVAAWDAGQALALATNAQTAFFSITTGDVGTWAVPLGGGTPRKVSAIGATALAASEGALYLANLSSVTRFALDSGVESTLVAGESHVGRLALTSSALIWAFGTVYRGPADGGLRSVPLEGGNSTLLAAATNPAGLASDGTTVVCTSARQQLSGGLFGVGGSDNPGSLFQIDGDGGTTLLPIDIGGNPGDGPIALDSEAVYWLNEYGAVEKTLRQ